MLEFRMVRPVYTPQQAKHANKHVGGDVFFSVSQQSVYFCAFFFTLLLYTRSSTLSKIIPPLHLEGVGEFLNMS